MPWRGGGRRFMANAIKNSHIFFGKPSLVINLQLKVFSPELISFVLSLKADSSWALIYGPRFWQYWILANHLAQFRCSVCLWKLASCGNFRNYSQQFRRFLQQSVTTPACPAQFAAIGELPSPKCSKKVKMKITIIAKVVIVRKKSELWIWNIQNSCHKQTNFIAQALALFFFIIIFA